jgi:hypothetical protein
MNSGSIPGGSPVMPMSVMPKASRKASSSATTWSASPTIHVWGIGCASFLPKVYVSGVSAKNFSYTRIL